jgi:hypothetical protein
LQGLAQAEAAHRRLTAQVMVRPVFHNIEHWNLGDRFSLGRIHTAGHQPSLTAGRFAVH